MDMAKLCSSCTICSFMPTQEHQRVLRWHKADKLVGEDTAAVLFIDDAPNWESVDRGMRVVLTLLDIPFVYTQSIRCEYQPKIIHYEDEKVALARCAVWTHHLLEQRRVIVTTEKGLRQMRIDPKTINVGEMKATVKYGLILHVAPLWSMATAEVPTLKSKVDRLLKEAELR